MMWTYKNLKKIKDVKVKHVISAGVFPILLLLVVTSWLSNSSEPIISDVFCYEDHSQGGVFVCRPTCRDGYYSLPWMEKCQKFLTCKEIQSSSKELIKVIGGGDVKNVHQVRINSFDMAYNILQNEKYKKEFLHGMGKLRQFITDHKVTQLIGYCKNTFVAELHPFGNAANFEYLMNSPLYHHLNTISMRFKMCINYVELISYFHNHPSGTYVFCDSNTLIDTLKQYLLTPSFGLVANDLDDLTEKKPHEKIICGKSALWGDFVAPEQRWHGSVETYNLSQMKGYDEKVDIWKIPDVCVHFLGNSKEGEQAKFQLFKIHNACKSENPKQRPSAKDVLAEYKRIQNHFLYY